MINAILGVLIGPFWAAITAIFVGLIRNLFGVGTVFAFPGGIPGGIVVGTVYWFLKNLKVNRKTCFISALSEPIGTLLIGVPLSLFLVAPWIGFQRFTQLTAENGALISFFILGAGWALSCIPGSIMGFILLLVLDKAGINRESLSGEK
jgi:energy coupling factor transporter S component ThiW